MQKLSSTHNAFYVHIVNLENTKIQFINEFGDVCPIIFSTEREILRWKCSGEYHWYLY